jgi:nucleoside-diphosphate-sugar epimerase
MIVISGITSSLGIALSLLLAEKGIGVLGFARRIDPVKEILSHPLIQLRSVDINDEVLMREICSHAEGVIHLAALSAPWGKYADFFRVNVEGTQSMIRAASHSKIKRFVHVSTPSLYFNYHDRLDISETDALPLSSVNAYAATKKMAEEAVDLAFSEGLPAITLRPRAIFGPHDKTLFPRVLKACQEGGIPTFRKKSPLVDVTYVDNVAHAVCLALNAPASCLGQKYNITNGEPALLENILELLFAQLSLPLRTRRIPYFIAYSIALLSELKGRLTGKEPLLTRYGVGVMNYSQTLSIEKAKQELNYQPIISINEGIKRYVDWLHAQ